MRSARDAFLQGEEGTQDEHAHHRMEDDEDEATPRSSAAAAGATAHTSTTTAAAASAASPASSSAGRPTHSSAAAHPSASSLSPSGAISLVHSSAQLLVLEFPARSQFGVDWWSFHVGHAFQGMKMVPRGVHFIWTAASPHESTQAGSGVLDPDMASRLGSFIWLESTDTWVRRWNPAEEALEAISDEAEEQRYIAAARRLEFDRGQGSYPLEDRRRWTDLTDCITRELVERLEPVDRKIGVGKMAKYALEDKKQKTPHVEEVDEVKEEQKQQRNPVAMEDVTMAEPGGAATVTAVPTVAASKPPRSAPAPSSSFYTRIPTVRSFFLRQQQQQQQQAASLTPEERAHALTQLHMDQSPILESIFSASTATSTLAAVSNPPDGDHAPLLTPAELDLLGELQFAFTAFLIGHDYEGFDAWKDLTRLLTSCTQSLEHHPAFYEYWLGSVLHAQLAALPRDFFVDAISGENFLLPCLRDLFDRLAGGVVPASLLVAAEAARRYLQANFHGHVHLPSAAIGTEVAADWNDRHEPSGVSSGSDGGVSSSITSAELRAFKRQLQDQEGEYGPTIADEATED
jgi:A1 cistron-splicing factor AAR2